MSAMAQTQDGEMQCYVLNWFHWNGEIEYEQHFIHGWVWLPVVPKPKGLQRRPAYQSAFRTETKVNWTEHVAELSG
jgi:hypothetical protein